MTDLNALKNLPEIDVGEYDPIHVAASEWLLQLQDPRLSVEQTLAWQHWMSTDARHAQAFRRMEDVWSRFQIVPKPPWPIPQDPSGGFRFPWGKLALAASVTGIVLGATLAVWVGRGVSGGFGPSPLAAKSQTLETAVGENRSLRLPDGSQVVLGGHTRLELAFDSTSRKLTLEWGEAFFNVAKDERRPFSVRAGAATITALGTEFNVRRAEERVSIAVIEGRVLVEPKPSVLEQLPWVGERLSSTPQRRPQRIVAGKRTTVSEAGFEPVSDLPDPALAMAWQSGRLAFEREPLRFVLEDVNRYAKKPIVLADESIGDLKITGTVLSDNVSGWVASLESAFALRAVEEPDRVLLRHAQ